MFDHSSNTQWTPQKEGTATNACKPANVVLIWCWCVFDIVHYGFAAKTGVPTVCHKSRDGAPSIANTAVRRFWTSMNAQRGRMLPLRPEPRSYNHARCTARAHRTDTYILGVGASRHGKRLRCNAEPTMPTHDVAHHRVNACHHVPNHEMGVD